MSLLLLSHYKTLLYITLHYFTYEGFVFIPIYYIRTLPVELSSCLRTLLPFCLSAFLPSWLPAFLPSYLSLLIDYLLPHPSIISLAHSLTNSFSLSPPSPLPSLPLLSRTEVRSVNDQILFPLTLTFPFTLQDDTIQYNSLPFLPLLHSLSHSHTYTHTLTKTHPHIILSFLNITKIKESASN